MSLFSSFFSVLLSVILLKKTKLIKVQLIEVLGISNILILEFRRRGYMVYLPDFTVIVLVCEEIVYFQIVDPNGDAIIAFEMNDLPLPKDHGFPCRAIIPGHAGAQQPKWIHRLEIINEPYCVLQCLNFAPDITFENDLASWPPKDMDAAYRARLVVQEMPVQSLICQPPQNSTIGARGGLDKIKVKGVAWSGGGSGIKRVDISIDGGKHFTDSTLYKPVEQRRRGEWGWTLFNREVELDEATKKRLAKGEKVNVILVSKAVDSSFNVQPENPEPYVNPRATAANHWYRVSVTLDPALPAGQVINPMAQLAGDGRHANFPSGGAFKIPQKEAGWDTDQIAESGRWMGLYQPKSSSAKREPYSTEKIDWDYYQNLKAPSFYEKAEVIY